jgi:hypothetical protein
METGNNVKIIGIMFLCHTFITYKRLQANKTIEEVKGKLAEELCTFGAGKATADLIF